MYTDNSGMGSARRVVKAMQRTASRARSQ
jgi:hypothetical protein